MDAQGKKPFTCQGSATTMQHVFIRPSGSTHSHDVGDENSPRPPLPTQKPNLSASLRPGRSASRQRTLLGRAQASAELWLALASARTRTRAPTTHPLASAAQFRLSFFLLFPSPLVYSLAMGTSSESPTRPSIIDVESQRDEAGSKDWEQEERERRCANFPQNSPNTLERARIECDKRPKSSYGLDTLLKEGRRGFFGHKRNIG